LGVETTHGPETIADLQRDLAAGNEFTDAELAINREGRIAETQVSRLLRRALHPFVSASGLLLGSLLFLVVTYEFLHFSRSLVPGSLLTSVPKTLLAFVAMRVSGLAFFVALLILGGALLALPGGFFKSVGTVFSLALDLAAGRALCIEGRTSTSWASEGGRGLKALRRGELYWYIVQDQYLLVTLEGYQAMRAYSGSVSKVYVAPRSKLLLSLEPIKIRQAALVDGPSASSN
jgi:hypothetical protein